MKTTGTARHEKTGHKSLLGALISIKLAPPNGVLPWKVEGSFSRPRGRLARPSAGVEAIPPGRSEWKVCAKPFKSDDLAEMLSAALVSAVN